METRPWRARPLRIGVLLGIPFGWELVLQILGLFLRFLSSCLIQLLNAIGLFGILLLLELPLLLIDLVDQREEVNRALSWHRLARRPRKLAGVLRLSEVHHHEVVRILEFILWPAALGAVPDRSVEHRILKLGPVNGVAFVQPGPTRRAAGARASLLPATFVDVFEAMLVAVWQAEFFRR